MSEQNRTGRRVWTIGDPQPGSPAPSAPPAGAPLSAPPPAAGQTPPPAAQVPASAPPQVPAPGASPFPALAPAVTPPQTAAPGVPPMPAPAAAPVSQQLSSAAPAPNAAPVAAPASQPYAAPPPPGVVAPTTPAPTVAPVATHVLDAPVRPAAAATVAPPATSIYAVADPTFANPTTTTSTASVGSVFDAPPAPGPGQAGSDPDIVACLNAVVLAGASDLHISAKAPPMMRVDGSLTPIEGMPIWDPEKVSQALGSILSPTNRERFEQDLELDFAYTLSETARFRVNMYRQRDSFGAAFRLIPTQIKKLDALGIPDKVGYFSTLPRGLVLVTGPTGSGKSTTLAALIDMVNSTRRDHIVTVEDPIEFMHRNKKSLVNQREVGHDTHSFAAALKHVLRQDPDVILIGELRDLETISVALTAAETGHLVFATLHTQDAGQTIDRVIDVFPPHQQGQIRTQLAATLQGVVCQTLVKRASGSGRAVATEILVTTPAIANLIREGKTYQIRSALQAGRDLGMHTMDQHLAELVHAGAVTAEVAKERAQSLEDFKQLLNRYDGNSVNTGASR